MSIMHIGLLPAVDWIMIEDTIALRHHRVAQQVRRINEARQRIAILEREGHTDLVRSSRRFLARMEGVLDQARDDFRVAVQRHLA